MDRGKAEGDNHHGDPAEGKMVTDDCAWTGQLLAHPEAPRPTAGGGCRGEDAGARVLVPYRSRSSWQPQPALHLQEHLPVTSRAGGLGLCWWANIRMGLLGMCTGAGLMVNVTTCTSAVVSASGCVWAHLPTTSSLGPGRSLTFRGCSIPWQ